MIKLASARASGEAQLELHFSDGSFGTWSAAELIRRDTELTRPLADPDYFRRAFVEAGALAWPNGLELSAHSLHSRLQGAGALTHKAA
jgi:hypothetical protein